jgi:N-acetylglucosaminyldiphosphoundecaprenol N-acetyl-beta-D-mannosaminyltransferase
VSAQTRRIAIGHVPIDVLTFAEAIDAIAALVEARSGGYVFTPNIDHVVRADENEEFAAAYQHASLSLADGMPVVWASRLLPSQLPERISGSDIFVPLLERAGKRGWRVALLGAGPGIAQKVAGIAKERWGVEVVLVDAPMLRLEDQATITRMTQQIVEARADLVFFAFGSPKQEILIGRIAKAVSPAVLIGVGATFDFVAGTVKRAPKILRRVGLEWAYRLAQEPRRLWRRYLVDDPKFALIVARTLRKV